MTEHLCVVCPQLRPGDPNTYERPHACPVCRTRLCAILDGIANQHAHLDATKGRGQTQRVSGSRTPPLPLRLDPLDLALPPHIHAVHDPNHDQTGHPGIATILDSWARDWQTHRWANAWLPSPTVPALTRWLRRWLEPACDQHPAIDEFAAEIRGLLRPLYRANGLSGPAVELLDVPCRRCDWLALAPVPRQDRIECLNCGDLSSGDEYDRWTGLLAAGVRELAVDFNLDALLYVDEAALLAKVTQNTVRLWVSRGVLAIAERDYGRPRFLARDVLEAERTTRTGQALRAS